MNRWQRPLLIIIFFAGLAVALWPVGQAAHGWWAQKSLKAAWEASIAQPDNEAGTAESGAKGREQHGGSRDRGHKAAMSATAGSPDASVPGSSPKIRTKLAGHRESSGKNPPPRWRPLRLLIPEIDLDAFVVPGVDDSTLRRGPGHDPLSALPGTPGNCVIAGHRNAYGWWFYRLDRLQEGSLIRLETPEARYEYRVVLRDVVRETDTWLLASTVVADAPPRLTLYTCTLPKTDNRLFVIADLVKREAINRT